MKTHFAYRDIGNESNTQDDWSATFCGLEYYESPVTDREEFVTCKNCLRVINSKNNVSNFVTHNVN